MALPMGLWYLLSDSHRKHMGRRVNIPYPRSDRTSVVIKAAAAFTVAEAISTSAVDIRDHPGGCVCWLLPTDLTGVTEVTIVAYGSDDGTTIPIAADGSRIPADDTIAEGNWRPLPYKATYTVADGTLVDDKAAPSFRIPQVVGVVKFAVAADGAGGSYSLRAQRLA